MAVTGSDALPVVGIDENGLGPLLGPLVTTAVGLCVRRYRQKHLLELGQELGIDDSKVTAGFGAMAFSEALCLACVETLTGRLPRDVDALFESLLLHRPATLRRLCPPGSRPQCWEAPLPLPCFGGDVDEGRSVLEALRKKGVRLSYLRSGVSCVGDLNQRLARGQSRVEVDLELMELLLLDAHARLSSPLHAVCGMVGGIRKYQDKLRHLRPEDLRTTRTKRGVLAYTFEALGTVTFEVDADARHFPVALASMLGKYVRELWMERQNRFYQMRSPELAKVSGYHDPVTRRFVEQSARLRGQLGIDLGCFIRESKKSQSDVRTLPLFKASS